MLVATSSCATGDAFESRGSSRRKAAWSVRTTTRRALSLVCFSGGRFRGGRLSRFAAGHGAVWRAPRGRAGHVHLVIGSPTHPSRQQLPVRRRECFTGRTPRSTERTTRRLAIRDDTQPSSQRRKNSPPTNGGIVAPVPRVARRKTPRAIPYQTSHRGFALEGERRDPTTAVPCGPRIAEPQTRGAHGRVRP